MKNILFIAILFLYTKSGQAQNTAALDKGFEILRIDKPIDQLKMYLIRTDPSDLWSDESVNIGEAVTTAWLFDFKKAGMNTYFGQAIKRVELFFDGTYDTAGNPSHEKVYSFVIYTEAPAHKMDFLTKIVQVYGTYEPWYDPKNKQLARADWLSPSTLLSIFLGEDPESGEKEDYCTARYSRTYGD